MQLVQTRVLAAEDAPTRGNIVLIRFALSPDPHSLFLSAVAIALLAGGLAGCEKPEEIRVYTVAKPPPVEHHDAGDVHAAGRVPDGAVPDRDAAAGKRAGNASVGQPTEMLGAITPRGKMIWFFKLTGTSSAVAVVKKDFVYFINSVKFGDKGPEWDLPEGWKAEAGSEMRFATIRIASAEGPLEMSVIPLPSAEEKFEPQLLANVNRWRGQVGLGPLTAAQLADSKEVIKFELNGEPVWFTDFVGEGQGNSMGGPMAGKRPAPREAAATKSSGGKLPFDCQVPEGWTPAQPGQFQLAAFDVRDGDRQASITISTAGGNLAANINRWRGQVGLADASAAEIDQQGQKIQIDGHDGTSVELVGPEASSPRKTILGVVVEVQGKQWFIKLTGDAELAAREKEHFEEFVKSIRFR